MAEDVKRKKVKVEVEVVELKIQLSTEFFDNMEKAKKQVADQRGYDVSYGEYIQEAMEDLVKMVEEYSSKLVQASEIIKEQDNALGNPTPEEYEKIKNGEKPVDPSTGEVEEDVPEELYAHIIKDEDKRTMYQ
jgi:uncharacterized protein YpbB